MRHEATSMVATTPGRRARGRDRASGGSQEMMRHCEMLLDSERQKAKGKNQKAKVKNQE